MSTTPDRVPSLQPKQCPLAQIAYWAIDIESRRTEGCDGTDCIMHNCAWWSEMHQCCAVLRPLIPLPEPNLRTGEDE